MKETIIIWNHDLPRNDPNDEARPHFPKFSRILSLIAFVTLYEVIITGSFLTSSLLGSKITSNTIYLFLNPTMILYLFTAQLDLSNIMNSRGKYCMRSNLNCILKLKFNKQGNLRRKEALEPNKE